MNLWHSMVGEELPGGFPIEGIWVEDNGEYIIQRPTSDGVDYGSADDTRRKTKINDSINDSF
jgi:hypothetical protein